MYFIYSARVKKETLKSRRAVIGRVGNTLRAGIIERHGVLIGIAAIFIAAASFYWIRNDMVLERLEGQMASRFAGFYKYDKPVYLPDIKLAGPRGEDVDLGNFKGKFLVLTFWATWCFSCVEELPQLKTLQSHYVTGDWNVIAVSIDNRSNVKKIVDLLMNYNVGKVAGYHDYTYELQRALLPEKLPVTYIVNERGRLLYKIQGATAWASPDIVEFLDYVAKVK